jgi:hypothetical protein
MSRNVRRAQSDRPLPPHTHLKRLGFSMPAPPATMRTSAVQWRGDFRKKVFGPRILRRSKRSATYVQVKNIVSENRVASCTPPFRTFPRVRYGRARHRHFPNRRYGRMHVWDAVPTRVGTPSPAARPCRRHRPTGSLWVRPAGMSDGHPDSPIVHRTLQSLLGSPSVETLLVVGPSPPTSRRCKAPSFAIGQSLAPWIIRTRHGPQPEAKAAWSLHVEAPGGSPHG